MARRIRRGDRPGLTLVEVLVVIAITGLLMALLIPAVNGSRESSRKTACSNNLRQIAIASFAHLEQQGTFPSSGFITMSSSQISGSLGFHELQGGSWLYNILPYIDLGHLRDVPSSQVSGTCPSIYRCPTTFSSRTFRQCEASYGGNLGTPDNRFPSTGNGYCSSLALSRGSVDETGTEVKFGEIPGLPPNKQELVRQQTSGYPHAIPNLPQSPRGSPGCRGPATGVIAPFGRVRAAHAKDGLSKTFLAGERYDDRSETEGSGSSNIQQWTKGLYYGTVRLTKDPPRCALTLTSNWDYEHRNFGARHSDSCGMAMCDGSVRQVAYSIDPIIFRDGGTRNGYGDTSSGNADD